MQALALFRSRCTMRVAVGFAAAGLAAAGLAGCSGGAPAAANGTSSTATTVASTPPASASTTSSSTSSTTTTTTLPPTTTTTLPPSFGIGMVEQTFVNPGDIPVDYGTGARSLLTEIRYPTLAGGGGEIAGAAPARAYGPFPVVVFAHGYDVTPDTYQPLLDAWVRAGFVVVAPFFPVENEDEVQALGGPYSRAGSEAEDDLYNEPSDLAFLVDTVVALARHASKGPAGLLDGLVDPNELVLAGQSDGADAVAALEYDRAYPYSADFAALSARPRVVAVLSGAELGPAADYRTPPAPPVLLVVQSATDQCNVPQDSTALYDALAYPARPAKWFLELDNSTHLGPYDSDSGAGQVVQATTTNIFELGLGLRGPPATVVVADVRASGQAGLTTGEAAPALTALPALAEACSPPVGSSG